jgi:alpha-amylase
MTSIPNNWRIFQILTSKGPNGNPKNVNGKAEDDFDFANLSEHDAWGVGDWEGIRLFILPWVKKNGFNAIQISPITRQIVGSTDEETGLRYAPNHAYHAKTLAPSINSIELEPHFGSKLELMRLIRDAHSMDIKVVADIVPNHLGYDCPLKLEHPEFFYNLDDLLLAQEAGDEVRAYVVNDKKMGGLPGLRHEHWEVRRRLDLLWLFHIQLGFDAFRVDALCHIGEFYQKYLRESSPLAGYPLLGNPYPVFAENYAGNIFKDDAGREIGGHVAFWNLGYGTTGHPWHFVCQKQVAKAGYSANVNKLADMQKLLIQNNAKCVGFIDNHDTDRCYTACLEAGNLADAAAERVHIMLVLLYGYVSPPAVLYGTDTLAEGNGVRSKTSCRVNWTPPFKTPTLTLLRKLNRARASYPALESGWYDERYVGNGVLCYIRGLADNDPVVVICNLWDSSVNTESLEGSIQLGNHFSDCVLHDLTGLATNTFSVIGGRLHGVLPPRSAYILSVE